MADDVKDEAAAPQAATPSIGDRATQFWAAISNWYEWLPANAVRASIAMTLLACMLVMEWLSPKEGQYKVPPELITAEGTAVGFYLGQAELSPGMTAVISLVIATVSAAFFLCNGWLPEAINQQLGTVIGLYFARKQAAAEAADPVHTKP